MAWEERGSCLNIFRMKSRGQISDTFTNYEAKYLLRKSVDHVLTYFGREIAVGSLKCSGITRQKPCCARGWIMSKHIPNVKSRSDLRYIHELRGKSLVAQSRHGMGGAWIMYKHIPNEKSRSDLRNVHELQGKRLVAQSRPSMGGAWIMYKHIPNENSRSDLIDVHELLGKSLVKQSDLRNVQELRGRSLVAQVSETRRFALYLRNRVDLILELEWSWHGRSVDHVLRYSEREIAIGSPKLSRIMRQKPSCAIVMVWEWSWHGRSVDHVLRYSGREIAVGSPKRSRIIRKKPSCPSEWRNRVDLMLELESSWHGSSVDHVLTYSGREIVVGSHKRSRITRQKPSCASE
ncbi:uncharacterized protein G2W53_039875 [Senna tora]|uniref:Uncharacterized protein n=1 Tax=Senna tora TaxID=362788 RepID=A0A834SPC4_9FABA|nr:uncharacterized protein G2W53_039875 [Senna tora]